MDWAKFYFDLTTTERQWSWAIIGIIYLLGTIFTRMAVFHRLVKETKRMDPHLYSEVRNLYLRNCTPGWIVFSVSFFLVIGTWVGWKSSSIEAGPLALSCLLLSLLFFVSIILHLTAYGEAVLTVLGQRMGVEREF